jgi:hypothetical protein
MTEHQQKTLFNELIQYRMVYLQDKINECKESERSSNDPFDKKFLAESIKFWQEELYRLKKIKL